MCFNKNKNKYLPILYMNLGIAHTGWLAHGFTSGSRMVDDWFVLTLMGQVSATLPEVG